MYEQFKNTNQIAEEGANEAVNVMNKASETARACPKCKSILSEGQKFCPNCGTTLEDTMHHHTSTCGYCGADVPYGTSFCQRCGKQVYSSSDVAQKEDKGNKKKFIIGGIVAAIAVVAIIVASLVTKEIPVDDIVLSESSIELKEEETKNISCNVYPSDATDKTVTWTSSDNSVATVNQYGMITAVGKGACTITATSGEQKETIKVTVKSNVDFQALYDDYCVSTWASLGSDKSYLSVDSNPYDYDDGDYRYTSVVCDAIEKVNKALGLPDSLYEEMLQTTWSMGKQSETYDKVGVTISWTYHPDKGLEVTYKLINE